MCMTDELFDFIKDIFLVLMKILLWNEIIIIITIIIIIIISSYEKSKYYNIIWTFFLSANYNFSPVHTMYTRLIKANIPAYINLLQVSKKQRL